MELSNEGTGVLGAGILDEILTIRTPRKVEVNAAKFFVGGMTVTITKEINSKSEKCLMHIAEVNPKRNEIEFNEALPLWVSAGCYILLNGKE